MTDSMLEKAARALCDHEYGQPMWDALPETEVEACRQYRAGNNPSVGFRASFRQDARIVVEALRHPSNSAMEIGARRMTVNRNTPFAGALDVWDAMIDAILAEEPK